MSSYRRRRVKCHICNREMQSNHLNRHMQRADHQSDNTEREYGKGLWTQTVNNQMKRGYGMDDHQVSESSDSEANDGEDSESDSEMADYESSESGEDSNMQAEGGIGKYIWKWGAGKLLTFLNCAINSPKCSVRDASVVRASCKSCLSS